MESYLQQVLSWDCTLTYILKKRGGLSKFASMIYSNNINELCVIITRFYQKGGNEN